MRKRSFLIVDPDVHFARLLSEHLSPFGIDASMAETEAEAVRLVQSREPTVVVLDALMAAQNGFELYRRLRMIRSEVEIVIAGKISPRASWQAAGTRKPISKVSGPDAFIRALKRWKLISQVSARHQHQAPSPSPDAIVIGGGVVGSDTVSRRTLSPRRPSLDEETPLKGGSPQSKRRGPMEDSKDDGALDIDVEEAEGDGRFLASRTPEQLERLERLHRGGHIPSIPLDHDAEAAESERQFLASRTPDELERLGQLNRGVAKGGIDLTPLLRD
jgi:ActR/RegA family two-component response regulator